MSIIVGSKQPTIVTQLPTDAKVGETVFYAADAATGVYWQLMYDGLGSYPWKYVGGAPLYCLGPHAYQKINSTSYINLDGVAISTHLPGDYDVRLDAQIVQPWNVTARATFLGISHSAAPTPIDYVYPIIYTPTSSADTGVSRLTRMEVMSDNNTFQAQGKVNEGEGHVGYCRLTVTPVRVAA